MFTRDTARDVFASAVTSLGLLLVLVGLPAALGTVIGWPLPRRLPSPDAVVTALRYGDIAPQTMLRVLAVVLWTTWALVVLAVGLEVVAVVRGTVARRLPGAAALQHMAARIVATVMLLASVATRASAAPLPTALPQPTPAAVALDSPSAADTGGPPSPRSSTRATGAVWTVERRDSLWTIAERALGDGRRWREIADLNVGRTQPDGGRLQRGDTLIRPGWRLELPPDATPRERPTHIAVEAGDDLWHLAEEHLGDGDRWRALFAENRGRRQPDGRRLTDPDLIRPGWVLELPDRRDPSAGRHGGRRGNPARPGPDGRPGRQDRPRPGVDERTASEIMPPPVTPRTLRSRLGSQDQPPRPTAPTDGSGPRTSGPPPGRSSARDHAGHPQLTNAASGTTGTSATALRPAADLVWPAAGALITAGLVTMLARRRRHWLRVNGGTRAVGPVDQETVELERWLRSMADHELERRLDRALCVLTDHFEEHGASPTVAAVEIGDRVTLRLADPPGTAPPGIVPSADGRRWTLSHELEMAAPATDRRYVPALLSCGVLPSGSLLLINPLAAGVLGVVGEGGALAEAATSWTTELASGAAAKGVEIVVVGGHHDLVERLARVTIAATVEGAVERVRRVLDDADGGGAHASHVVVVHAPPITRAAAAGLRRAIAHPRAGLVLIGGHADTHLHLVGERVRLAPDDEWLDAPAWLTPDDWDRVATLLRRSGGGPAPVAPRPPLHGAPTAHPAVEARDAPDPAEPEHVVGVLGPLTIDGRHAALDTDAGQLLTYLAVERTGADPASLRQLLWPARSGEDHVTDAVARIVAAVPRGDAPVVIDTDDGRLELADSVSTDLAVFLGLVGGLDLLPLSDQAQRMHAALDLVRGEPFATGAEWAHATGRALRTTALIIDVAHRLATQALAVSDLGRATFAVDRGLRAAPTSELLHRDGLRVADAAGDVDGLDARMKALRDRVEADGAWVSHETEALYLRLRGEPTAGDGHQRDAS